MLRRAGRDAGGGSRSGERDGGGRVTRGYHGFVVIGRGDGMWDFTFEFYSCMYVCMHILV